MIFQNKFNIKTDFIFSTGPACRPAEALRRNNLRYISSPFDWMMSYKLETMITYFKKGFDNFFKNTEDMNCDKGGFKRIRDISTGMISMHSFRVNENFDKRYLEFQKIMKYRFERLIKILKNSNNITFLSNRNNELELIKNFLKDFDNIFKDKILNYINITNSSNEKIESYQLSNDIILYDIQFNDIHPKGSTAENPNFWLGNSKLWDEILKNVTLTNIFQEKLSITEDKIQK